MVRQAWHFQQIGAEIAQEAVHKHAVGLAFEIAERQIDEQYLAIAVCVQSRDEAEVGRCQYDIAAVVAARDIAGIVEEAVNVARDGLHLVGRGCGHRFILVSLSLWTLNGFDGFPFCFWFRV